jgi:hypothetical protein
MIFIKIIHGEKEAKLFAARDFEGDKRTCLAPYSRYFTAQYLGVHSTKSAAVCGGKTFRIIPLQMDMTGGGDGRNALDQQQISAVRMARQNYISYQGRLPPVGKRIGKDDLSFQQGGQHRSSVHAHAQTELYQP